ncbi:DUF4142 domain-containing protein [Sphingomonas bacterium]|uniref:DUF4142 domain-containing protein n=1 Tax=Sphingomonas bacterium TaxID=1895847 RepID=UPI002626A8C4|nr:DUF4142 domain-containing protein [Sphingomonas bacterium]MDB5677089.1 hypothetical protein [Sphingomonas bacterium]
MTLHNLRYLTPLALAIGLAACGSKTTTIDTTNTVTDVASNTDVAMNATGDAAAATPAQAFADKAAKSDAFEIAAARLAATNASSAAVKDFATKMIAAHTDSTIKIKKAAEGAAPAIVPDATLTDEQSAKLADLGKLKGADFDKAYAAGQVAAHEEALALMTDYAANGDAPSLKAAAGEIVPVVKGHLVMARALPAK